MYPRTILGFLLQRYKEKTKYANFYSNFFSALCIFNKRRKLPANRGIAGRSDVICCKDLSDLIRELPGLILDQIVSMGHIISI